jgi:hypothetical protein
MKNQLKIIAAGLGLAVGGLSLFGVSASAMSASGVAAISKVNPVSDAVGLPVEHVQYYPYGFPCVFPFPLGFGTGSDACGRLAFKLVVSFDSL